MLPIVDSLVQALRLLFDALMASGVSADVLKRELDEAAVRRANLAADAAEAAKFRGGP